MLSENYTQAINHLFKALKTNPYYPFTDYKSWKSETIKSYVISISSILPEVVEDLKKEQIKEEDTYNEEEILNIYMNAVSQIEFPHMVSYTSLIIDIIEQAESEYLNKIIEEKLREDICESPIQNYIKGEILKYLPKGTERINKLYTDRLDDVISEFKKVLEIDEDFPLMNNKYGTMLLFKEIENGSSEFSNSMHYIEKGFEYFSKYGMKGLKKKRI